MKLHTWKHNNTQKIQEHLYVTFLKNYLSNIIPDSEIVVFILRSIEQ